MLSWLAASNEVRWDRIALAAIVAGAAIRVLWVLDLHPPFDYVYSDMGGYVDRARHLADGVGLTRADALYPPGTHILMALPMVVVGSGKAGLWGAAALWCLFSSLTPLVAWRLAGILLTPAAAALTALLTALWPLHITYAGYFLSETPALFLIVSALWLAYEAQRRSGRHALLLAATAGLLGGAAMANRPQLAFNMLVVALPLVLAWRAHWRTLGVFSGGAAVIITAVVLHNSAAAGKPTFISENGGLTFFLGHCDVHTVTTTDPAQGVTFTFAAPPAVQRGGGRNYEFSGVLVWDQEFFYRLGLQCIRENGPAHLRIVARSIFDMTVTSVPWPQSNEPVLRQVISTTNVLYSAALWPIVIAAILLIHRRRRGLRCGEAIMLAHLAMLLPLAVLIFGDPRFRTPYDVFGLALLAAAIADRLFDADSRLAFGETDLDC